MGLKIYDTVLLKGLVLHLLDATINLAPDGFLCILGIQYITGHFSNPSSTLSPNLSQTCILSYITF